MNRRVAIVCALLLTVVLPARAFDFGIRLSNGDSLFFNITNVKSHRVMVVSPQSVGTDYYYGHQQPTGTLVIPSEVEYRGEKYVVTAIGARAFSGCTLVRQVVMPETVEAIGAYAFYGCTSLRGPLVIGANVMSIGESAFYGCSSLSEVYFRARECTFMGGSMSMTVFGNCRSLRSVLLDGGVRRIPDYAFCGVDALKEAVVLPEMLQYIGDYAFAYCSSMYGDLVIPDKVESIGECAFHQCHSLNSITIGESVKHIGERAFYHCIGLNHITVKPFKPAEITLTSFSDIPKGTKLRVPCVSKKLYEHNPSWKKVATMETYGSCFFSVNAAMEDEEAGEIVGNGNYGYGENVTLMVVCAANYGFDGWSDGNRENPRRFVVTDNLAVMAKTRPSGTITIIDTLYRVDTVYSEGYKVIHDTVDLVEVSQSINDVKELTFDTKEKWVKWNFPRKEKVINVSLYNQTGMCVYTGDGRKGSVDMKRLPSGTYFVRIETVQRVIRCRFFMNSDRTWIGID